MLYCLKTNPKGDNREVMEIGQFDDCDSRLFLSSFKYLILYILQFAWTYLKFLFLKEKKKKGKKLNK